MAAATVDEWLRGGGRVIAASERAARSLTAAFHRARRREGLAAWPAPYIRDWRMFVRETWQEGSQDDLILLNGLQERTLWAEAVAASADGAGLLEGPRHRMAALAMRAHELLCAYAPRFLESEARGAWQQDAAVFSRWLSHFDDACCACSAVSEARLALELAPVLATSNSERQPLLLAGFDRLLPIQRQVFDAWGQWTELQPAAVGEASFCEAPDLQSELAACAQWCKDSLAADPNARLLVVTQNVAQRRGEIERALLRTDAAMQFEFSLGVPLSGIALARGAHLLLQWLSGPLEEREIDWLFSTRLATASYAEQHALTGFMRALRQRGRERMRWALDEFLAQQRGEELPRAWIVRIVQAKRVLAKASQRPQAPLAWAELVAELLQAADWLGTRRLTSAEFQALRRWQQTVDACASLGFDGRRIDWNEFLKVLGQALDETLFAPESRDAQVQIVGPAESAGLTADAIWFLGASEDAWPANGSMHPLLPLNLQREVGMPHASAQLDSDLARTMTARLMAAAPEIRFSYARRSGAVEVQASRIATEFAGAPQPLASQLTRQDDSLPIAVIYGDASRVSLRAANVTGGSTILSAQSQCPFKAFASTRLEAKGWEPAQAGLTAAQRGNLLHEVLHSVWGGPSAGIRTHAELVALRDLESFVEGHVQRVLAEEMPTAAREQMSARYLELEALRLRNLVAEWLRFEKTRVPFTVAETEVKRDVTVAGLNLRLRLDRIDRLNDETFLVIDYKTGYASPKEWELPRPEDVQLPLYAGFALNRETQPVGGLVFATVRTGEECFTGRVGDAKVTLLPNLSHANGLVKRKFNAEELMDWRDYIEQMARDFLDGRAEADPRKYPETCKHCELPVLCRVHENRAATNDAGDEESGDE